MTVAGKLHAGVKPDSQSHGPRCTLGVTSYEDDLFTS